MRSKYAPQLITANIEELSDPAKPERRLVAAMLTRAIQDATGNVNGDSEAAQSLSREARNWIFESAHRIRIKPFSFEWSCHILDLCPNFMRKSISEMDEPLYLPRNIKMYQTIRCIRRYYQHMPLE